MLLHYIRISLRNLNKYKTQTVISICAMAVSLTLMAIVSSFVLSITPSSLLSQPYADKVEQVKFDGKHFINGEKLSLILCHQFKNADEVHFQSFNSYGILPTSNSNTKEERSLISQTTLVDSGFLKFLGMKSVYTGKEIDSFSSGEVILSEKLARKLYGKENPIGKKLNVYYYYYPESGTDMEKSYVIKDVMKTPSPNDKILNFNRIPEVMITDDHFPESEHASCYFVLRDGSSKEALLEELKEIFPDSEVKLENIKKRFTDDMADIVRTGLILFMFLFVLVSFSNYLRQQTQLFRLREREVALRTCIGSQPSSLFALFSTEIMIVLSLTLLLTLTLISISTGFIVSRYEKVLESDDFYFNKTVPVALISTAILITISIACVAFTVRRIRMDQTGLALRMKPLPKHRIRNVGLTLQMTVSILFTWVSVLLFMSIPGFRKQYGIPEDTERYKKCLQVRVNGITPDKSKELFDKIESLQSLPSIDKIYKFIEHGMALPLDPDLKDYISYSVAYQNGEDWIDFLNLERENNQRKVNPAKYAYISKDFKQKLIDNNLWNGTTVNLPNIGEYEIKGEIDNIPFHSETNSNVIALYDEVQPVNFAYFDRIILPKAGREKEAMEEINNAIREILPSRIDIKAESFYNNVAQIYDVLFAVISIIYILSAVSVITTMAGVYAGVALDTRRRRKEMALRKLNGAGPKIIAMIFTRVYVWIITMAAVISVALFFITFDEIRRHILPEVSYGDIAIGYVITLLLIIAVTVFTIAWKIRDIMHADPIEYLKE